jgi:hypothetical protein
MHLNCEVHHSPVFNKDANISSVPRYWYTYLLLEQGRVSLLVTDVYCYVIVMEFLDHIFSVLLVFIHRWEYCSMRLVTRSMVYNVCIVHGLYQSLLL